MVRHFDTADWFETIDAAFRRHLGDNHSTRVNRPISTQFLASDDLVSDQFLLRRQLESAACALAECVLYMESTADADSLVIAERYSEAEGGWIYKVTVDCYDPGQDDPGQFDIANFRRLIGE